MKTSLMIIFLAFLVSCGGGSSSPAVNKGITSLWTGKDVAFFFDLSGQTIPFSNEPLNFTFGTGQRCDCSMTASGDEFSGSYLVSGCVYGGGGSGDPGCSTFNSMGTFQAIGLEMRLCRQSPAPTGCVDYK